MGKTTLALNIAINIAKNGIPVGFFSFEMKDKQIIWKILSRELGETVGSIRAGALDQSKWDLLGNNFGKLKNIPFYMNDKGFMTTTEMKAVIKTWKAKHGIEAVFIDYLQLIGASKEARGQNREAIVSGNTRDIKSMAMECNIPIALLCQLSRQGANVEPELHHLRESGAIEQDADNVIFIHMDEELTDREYPGWVEGDPEWIIKLMLKKGRLINKGNRLMILNGAHNNFRSLEFKNDLKPISYNNIRNFSEPNENTF
ncbi:DnaB-like helicase C-terminal domain-containing protein, partial [Arachidicoccus sp.]|uniref:DnaB-like helicase C-terminal domain-containing protein n=1 Tax=Arachidicoccus sp. TaxID=1872624 RepID=UPI003D23C094